MSANRRRWLANLVALAVAAAACVLQRFPPAGSRFYPRWHALVVISLPLAAAFLAITYWRSMKATPFLWPTIPHSLLKLFLGLIGIFTVVRNLAWL
jgi:hypothetical protein